MKQSLNSNKNINVQNVRICGRKNINAKKIFLENGLWLQLSALNWETFLVNLFGAAFGLLYYFHVRHIFESVTKFSHLSNTERELSLPIDTAFRYGFYKRIAQNESFVDGLRAIFRDEDVSFPGSFNRFRQYYLNPEVAEAGGFHVFRRFIRWTRLDIFFNKCSKGLGSIIDADAINENNLFSSCSSSGLGNLLYFHFNLIWVIESFTVLFLFHFGFILSESIVASAAAGLLFIICHPQRATAQWLFRSQIKLEWAIFLTQICIISKLVLKRTHPSWTSTVKIGISTGILILVAQTESQWLLISQLVIITIMQIGDLVTSYAASLIIFGQITGWQYASLICMDTSFIYWSFYFYTLMSSIITVYILKPVNDWIARDQKPRWKFCSKIFLVVAYLFLFLIIWKESRRVLGLSEDKRLSFPFKSNSLRVDSSVDLTSESVPGNYDESTGKLVEDLKKATPISGSLEEVVNITSIIHFCSQNRTKLSLVPFIAKYGFHMMAVLYVVFVCVLLPVTTSIRRNRTSIAQIRDKRRKPSSLHYTMSSSSRLDHMYSFIQKQNALTIFNLLQTLAFALFTIFLEERWELLFVSHVCLMLSLLCDQKRVFLTYHKRLPGKIYNGNLVHWPVVAIIFCIIFTMGKLHSDHMYKNSRGTFEIENQKRKHLAESMTWINDQTEKAFTTFAGVDISMVYIRLTTGRSCVTLRQRYDIHFTVEQDETERVDTKFGLTWSETHNRIYSMYSRRKSISEFHAALLPLNITHLFLNRDSCSNSNTPHSISKSTLESQSKTLMSFYDFIWQWGESSSSDENEIGFTGFHRSCDFTPLWDLAKGEVSAGHKQVDSIPIPNVLSLQKKTVRGNRKKLETESINGRRNDGEHESKPDTICVRLLNERNVKPFIKVFENSDYTILALSQKHPSNSRSRNINQSRAARG